MDGDGIHEIKRHLLLGKSYDKSKHHIKNQRHYLANKAPYRQSYGFSSSHVRVWKLNHKGWAPKNWCFRTVVLERTRAPWTARRSNQSILKEISSEYSLEGLLLKLKLQDFGCLMRTARCWERLKVGGEGYDRGRDSWIASNYLTQWTWV